MIKMQVQNQLNAFMVLVAALWVILAMVTMVLQETSHGGAVLSLWCEHTPQLAPGSVQPFKGHLCHPAPQTCRVLARCRLTPHAAAGAGLSA